MNHFPRSVSETVTDDEFSVRLSREAITPQRSDLFMYATYTGVQA